MPAHEPLIVTLLLDDKSFQFFDSLRQEHFPKERNFLKAHITLFHHLPADEEAPVRQKLQSIANETAPIKLLVAEIKSIGQGVAYRLDSPPLQTLHARLQRAWWDWLNPQDRQKFWPHITIQNKVKPEEARILHEQLQQNFEPFTAIGTGFSLWAYQGGPWKHLEDFTFS